MGRGTGVPNGSPGVGQGRGHIMNNPGRSRSPLEDASPSAGNQDNGQPVGRGPFVTTNGNLRTKNREVDITINDQV